MFGTLGVDPIEGEFQPLRVFFHLPLDFLVEIAVNIIPAIRRFW
jgi:hypothetical protein